ncbi:MAG: hypothetical protein QXP66_00955 [Candidatus Aenigmatarchaeota archaeon]
MDIFSQIKEMLSLEQEESEENNTEKTEQQKSRQQDNLIGEISKLAERFQKSADTELRAASAAIKYLLSQYNSLQAELANMQKSAEAFKLAKSLVDRGIISYRDLEKRASEIASDLDGWKKAISLIGVSAFGEKNLAFHSDQTPAGVDPLYKILIEEVGNG